MSDRLAWLKQSCPYCGAGPGARCQEWRYARRRHAVGHRAPALRLHIGRGWLERPCPTCKASSGEGCRTPSGRPASTVHTGRLRPARWELVSRSDVWETLELRGATSARVPFFGQAGRGGHTDVIRLYRLDGEALVEVERWTGRDELCYALEAPVWDRFGSFAGHPLVHGEVLWTADDRQVWIIGHRGNRSFEELIP
jgi:hypothetical protein